MVVTGDPDRSDLLTGLSGLQDVANRLEKLENIEVVRFTRGDVVRLSLGPFRDKVVPGLSSGNAQIHILAHFLPENRITLFRKCAGCGNDRSAVITNLR